MWNYNNFNKIPSFTIHYLKEDDIFIVEDSLTEFTTITKKWAEVVQDRLKWYQDISLIGLSFKDFPTYGYENCFTLKNTSNIKLITLSGHVSEANLSFLKHFPNITLLDMAYLTLSQGALQNIACLQNLEILRIAATYYPKCVPIKSIDFLESQAKLKEFYIAEASIEDISPISNLKELTVLELDAIPLKNINPIKGLKDLKILRVTNTHKLTNIEILQELIKLEELYLGGNKIANISPVQYLKNLKRLVLQQNNIRDIHSLADLQQLKYLNLLMNSITDITFLQNLSALKELGIFGNPLTEESKVMIEEILSKRKVKIH